MYSYNVGYKRMSVSRGFGYTLGHMLARTAVQIGKETAMKAIENRHKIIDAEFVDVGARWSTKHAKFGDSDYSRATNKPRPRDPATREPFINYKVGFFILAGLLGYYMYGKDYLYRVPPDVYKISYTKDGERRCHIRSNPPNQWDDFAIGYKC